MAAFDLVMALVAFISFIAGFLCGRVRDQSRDYAPRKAQSSSKGPYVRIDDGSPEEPHAADREAAGEKKSKYDSLFNYYTGEKRQEKHQAKTANVIKSRPITETYAGRRVIEEARQKSQNYVELRDSEETLPVMAAQPPAREEKRDGKKDEWTPMGFFED